MSDNNHGIILAGLALAYLYTKRAPTGGVIVTKGGTPMPASMPASVGSGNRQIAVGALAGLLQGLAASPANNTSQTYFPVTSLPDNAGVVQESVNYAAPAVADLVDTSDFSWFA